MNYELVRSINAAAVTAFHDSALAPEGAQWALPCTPFPVLWRKIADNHRCNALLSMEEERARHISLEDDALAICRHRIARYNFERSAAVSAIDERLLDMLGNVRRHARARSCSESAGAMIDALSVLAVRIHRMRFYTETHGSDSLPLQLRLSALAALVAQRINLAYRFDELMAGAVLGLACLAPRLPRRESPAQPIRDSARQRDVVT